MTHEEMKKAAWVSVLNDNDTYTGLDGCWIALTSPEIVTALDDDDMPVEDVPQPHYGLQALLEWAIDHGYFDDC